MIEAIYQRSHYERSIDYTQPLMPPLSPDELAWLNRPRQAGKDRVDEIMGRDREAATR